MYASYAAPRVNVKSGSLKIVKSSCTLCMENEYENWIPICILKLQIQLRFHRQYYVTLVYACIHPHILTPHLIPLHGKRKLFVNSQLLLSDKTRKSKVMTVGYSAR